MRDGGINKSPCGPPSKFLDAGDDKRCRKINHFACRAQLSDTGVSGGMSPKRIIAHYRAAISTWAGLHPRAKSTISTISILPILSWCPSN